MSVRRASNLPFALQPSTKRYHVIRPLSSSRPIFLDPHSAVSYGSCPPYKRALRRTLEWDIKARDELWCSCTPHTQSKASELDQGRSALPSRAKQEPPHARSHRRSRHPYRGPDEWQRPLGCQIRCATPSASAHPSTRRRWTVTGPGSRL